MKKVAENKCFSATLCFPREIAFSLQLVKGACYNTGEPWLPWHDYDRWGDGMLSSYCTYCLIKRQMEIIKDYGDEDKKSKYMKDVLKAVYEADEDATAPVIIAELNELHQSYFGSPYSFDDLKKQYNAMLLQKEDEIAEKINASQDKLLAAVKYARVGNYIDFGAMGSVDDEKLNALISSAIAEEIDMLEYRNFQQDLKSARHLAYLTDNCGEIVLDKLLIQTIAQEFPTLKITVIVRGMPVLNDATMEDAEMVGLADLVKVLPNGTKIAGTHLASITEEARDVIDNADLMISKGQGNFETLHGCGLNVYYMFLCKCDWFVTRFRLEQFKGVFVNEKNNRIK